MSNEVIGEVKILRCKEIGRNKIDKIEKREKKKEVLIEKGEKIRKRIDEIKEWGKVKIKWSYS